MESTLPALPVGSWRVQLERSRRPPGAQVDPRDFRSRGFSGEAIGDTSGDRLGGERGAADVTLRSKSAEGMIKDGDISDTVIPLIQIKVGVVVLLDVLQQAGIRCAGYILDRR